MSGVIRHLGIAAVLLAASVCAAVAQSSPKGDLLPELQLGQQPASAASAGNADFGPVDCVVDPEHYYLGPGDLLSVQLLGAISADVTVAVSADGSIMLPRFGALPARGLTLAKLRDTLAQMQQKRNPNAVISVSLLRPRNVYVRISGTGAEDGVYALPATTRVSSALHLVREQLRRPTGGGASAVSPYRASADRERQRISRKDNMSILQLWERSIPVVHGDGSLQVADALGALYMKKPALDPYVREGDLIHIPASTADYPVISISGQVHRPCIVPWKKGDRLSLLVASSLGAGEMAEAEKAELHAPGGKKTTFSLADVASGSFDPELEAGSFVVVPARESAVRPMVSVTGKVNNPGNYYIEPGTTKLIDAIEQAGGVADGGYLPLAYVLRDRGYRQPGTTDAEVDELRQYTTLTVLDTIWLNADIAMRPLTVSADVEAAMNGSAADNVTLRSGDIIVIPEDPNTVYVFGQVRKPGFVDFAKGQAAEWYIQKAGGNNEAAEPDRAVVIKGRTREWVPIDGAVVQSGDMVYVPRPKEVPPGQELQNYSLILSAVGTFVLILTTAINIFGTK